MMGSRLLRRRVRALLAAYASARYVPRYTLPTGWAYNSATGLVERTTAWNPAYQVAANEVLLTDQGSRSSNESLLQTTVTNAGSDAARVRLAPVSTDWGASALTIPNHNRSGVGLVIEPATVKDGTFPVAEGARVSAATSGLAPLRVNALNIPAIDLVSGTSKVRLVGLDITWDSAFAASSLSNVGTGTGTPGVFGFVTCFFGGAFVNEFIMDRCRVRGATGKRTLRLVRLHADKYALLGCYFADAHDHTTDSQCVVVDNNTRNGIFDNNYFAAAYGEALFIGGGGSTLADSTAMKDMVVRRNTFDYPAAYRTNGWPTKNLFETKGGERVLLEGNVFSNFFAGASFEFGNQYHPVTLKTSQWRMRDWTFRLNRFVNCSTFLNLKNEGDNNTEGAGAGISRLEVAHNVVLAPTGDVSGGYQFFNLMNDLGNADLPAEFLQEWSMRENTFRCGFGGGANASFFFDEISRNADRWSIENNIIASEAAGTPNTYYNVPAGSANTAAVNYAARTKSGGAWSGNAVANVSGASVIPGDTAYASVAALDLDANLKPNPTSPVLGKGADIDLVAAAIGTGGGGA